MMNLWHVYEATLQAMWLKNFITELQVVDSISRPLKLFVEDNSTIYSSKNNKRSTDGRHMDVKYLLVRKCLGGIDTMVEHIGTELMIADPQTKALPIEVFKRHVVSMCLVDSFDVVD